MDFASDPAILLAAICGYGGVDHIALFFSNIIRQDSAAQKSAIDVGHERLPGWDILAIANAFSDGKCIKKEEIVKDGPSFPVERRRPRDANKEARANVAVVTSCRIWQSLWPSGQSYCKSITRRINSQHD